MGGDRLMPARMIPVRSKISGQTAQLPERSWPLFAAYYDRLDVAPGDTNAPAPTPPAAPAGPAPDSVRRAAAKTTSKEK